MKRLLIFCGMAGPLLGSASPPLAEPFPPRIPCELPEGCGDAAFAGAEPRLPLFLRDTDATLTGDIDLPRRSVWGVDPARRPAAPSTSAPPFARPPSSAVRIVVSLPQQKAYVFKAGELIATSPVSTGRRGYETPVGTFPILQKKVHHRSTTYDNAPMPYMQRLTWSGVALHAGHVTGRPASHGCIRLPRSFARKLYGMTNFGTTVTITRQTPRSAKDALKLA